MARPTNPNEPLRGTASWYFKTFRWQFLQGLYADLKTHNPHGFPTNEPCKSVKEALGSVIAQARAARHNTFISNEFAAKMESIRSTYGTWNEHKIGQEGAIDRLGDFDILRKLKDRLREICSATAPISDPGPDLKLFQSFWEAFSTLAARNEDFFPTLNLAIRQSRKIATKSSQQ